MRPRPAKTDCIARSTSRRGSGGKKSEATRSPTPPPISASRTRLAEKPASPPGAMTTSRIAETAASATRSSPPPSRTAADMASRTISPICGGPLPISATIPSATRIPTTTPPTSCSARSRRCPNAAPSEMTAAIEAKAGASSDSRSSARYHAATAAVAVWRIGISRPRRRCGAMRTARVIRPGDIGAVHHGDRPRDLQLALGRQLIAWREGATAEARRRTVTSADAVGTQTGSDSLTKRRPLGRPWVLRARHRRSFGD